MTGFLGDHPLRVVVRLVLLSLLVGWALRWLDVAPADVGRWVLARVEDVLDLGVDAVARFGDTIALGAAVVVPVFILMRVLRHRRG